MSVRYLHRFEVTGNQFFWASDMNVEGLSYVVGNRLILQEIAISVDEGKGIRIRGKSGVGKSTLAQVLSRRIPVSTLSAPSSRSWRYIAGRLAASRFEVPERATYLPSDPFDVLVYPSVRDCFRRDASQAQIARALDDVNLPPSVIELDLWQLSGGMLQRLALARATLSKSPLLIADQLHEWLDESGRQLLAELMLSHVQDGGIALAVESTASPPAANFPAMRFEGQQLLPCMDAGAMDWTELPEQAVPGNRLVLEISGVKKAYSSGRRENVILNQANLASREGEWLGISGANGVGKSVLARVIAGLESSLEGTYRIFDRLTSEANRISQVAYLFQIPSQLLPFPTIEDLIKIVPAADRNQVISSLSSLGIAPKRRVTDLDTAAQRLIGFELLIIKRPKVVILDEPTWGADAEEVYRFIEHVRSRLTWPHTVLVISHDLNLLKRLCHRVVFLRNGQFSGS